MTQFKGCPGSRMVDFRNEETQEETTGKVTSQLKQWPIQMHLISPAAPYYQGADVLLTADCVAYAGWFPFGLPERKIHRHCLPQIR